MLCRSIIGVLSPLEKKTIPCDVTGAGENDRATFTNSTSERSNGSTTYAVKFIADMPEEIGVGDTDARFCQEPIFAHFAADDFDGGLWK